MKVKTGERLDWLEPAARRRCPIDDHDLSIPHIWIHCKVAQAIWDEMQRIWRRAKKAPNDDIPRPRTKAELMVLMAVSPFPAHERASNVDRHRWTILYQTAVWCLWKSYLTYSFGSEPQLWKVEIAVTYYRNQIIRNIAVDRIACISPKYEGQRGSKAMFRKLWGEEAIQMRLLRGPKCVANEPSNQIVESSSSECSASDIE